MLFVLIGWDTPDSRDKRPAARPDHLAYWKPLDDAGRIQIAGPMTDFAGSLFIAEFETIDEAREKIENDPYVKAGVFGRTEVHPFKGVLPLNKWSSQ
ncbi:MAG: hypothetical protein JJU11_11440 [Candidatus Sumerlaeia bacterium]|nr:hypothetical protein [Candidatus Sumerlaeia bacterium]